MKTPKGRIQTKKIKIVNEDILPLFRITNSEDLVINLIIPIWPLDLKQKLENFLIDYN